MESIGRTRRGLEWGEDGLTLVELLVVMLVIGILLGIAIPTFLTAQNSSKEAVAKTGVRQALTAQKQYYAETNNYASAAQLSAIEPSIQFDGTEAVLGKVYVRPGAANQVVELVSQSANGKCYWVKDSASAAPQYAMTTVEAEEDCTTTTPSYTSKIWE